jgi:hypothetical protein
LIPVILTSTASFLSFLITLTIIIVFSNSVFKEKVYTFLKHESILTALNLVTIFFMPIYKFSFLEISKSLWACVYYKYFKIYAASLLEMSAIIASIFSIINCIVMIKLTSSGRFLILAANLRPCLVLLFAMFAAGLLFGYQIFSTEIIQSNGSYFIIYTGFASTRQYSIFTLVSFTFRDGLLLTVLVSLNVYMMLEARKSLRKKLTFVNLNIQEQSKINAIKKSRNKLFKMVLVDSFINILGRTIVLVSIILQNILLLHLDLLSTWTHFIMTITCGMKFFSFYCFNKRFRNVFKSYFNQRST